MSSQPPSSQARAAPIAISTACHRLTRGYGSDYTRYELRGYLENQAAGEEINIAERDAHPDLKSLHEDFWLMDDQVAVRMVYDDEGHFLHPELIDDAAPYVSLRDIAMRHAESLNDYLARKKPKLTA